MSNLKTLHSLPIENSIKIETLEKKFFVKSSSKEYQDFLNMFRTLEKDFLTNSRLTITHTDLHPGNMLADKENVWIIDWQDAGLYAPVFDVARVALELHLVLSPEQEKAFLNDYFEREMTQEETINYKKAKALVAMKIIDSLIYAYTKNYSEKDKNSKITELFTKAKAGSKIINPVQDQESLIIYLLKELFNSMGI